MRTDMDEPAAVDANTDLSHAGVLTADELAERAFRYGDHDSTTGLQPGRQIAALEHHALVYGHVPADEAILAAGTYIWSPGEEPDALAAFTADPPTWVIFHRHKLTCTADAPPTECCCAPPDDPDSLWITDAAEGTPAAVPVTPVHPPTINSVYAVTAAKVDEWLAQPDLHQALADDGPVSATAFATTLLGNSGGSRYATTRLAAHLLMRLMQTQQLLAQQAAQYTRRPGDVPTADIARWLRKLATDPTDPDAQVHHADRIRAQQRPSTRR